MDEWEEWASGPVGQKGAGMAVAYRILPNPLAHSAHSAHSTSRGAQPRAISYQQHSSPDARLTASYSLAHRTFVQLNVGALYFSHAVPVAPATTTNNPRGD